MKPIFSRGPSLQIRLILAVLVALGVIIADSRLGTFSQIRTYMDTAVSPFYFVSNGPRELLDSVSQTLATRDQLELENRALRQELLLKNSDLLMLGQYKQENARLRELLGSPLRQDEQKMVTQVISTVNDPIAIRWLSIKAALTASTKASRLSVIKALWVRWSRSRS
ncbi:Rod shape-determining protein MreC [Klebsiella michiganensis]|uniref:Rod shape-determining protein MreC n=1 Tax=Klebsiella michiganensis TaxID=1134687 RepID=A0A7H4M551_9ENTR|nr:Rod shape-determining protein MreC [Klebsiella michiganensis]